MSKIAIAGSVLGLLLLASGQADAQTDYSKVEMKTTDLGHRTYMIEGMGGNITAAVGDNGIIWSTASSRRCTTRSRRRSQPSRRSRSAISSTRISMATIRAATRALPRTVPS